MHASIKKSPVFQLILMNALIALTYFLAGVFAVFVMPVSSHAASVWPSAGVALAAMLVIGWQGLLGIVVGSLATNSWHMLLLNPELPVTVALMWSFPMAVGAALQAIVSQKLIQSRIGLSLDLSKVTSVLQFVTLGGPIGCLVNSTLSASFLFSFGLIQRADLLESWFIWWSGDVIGVLTVTPVILASFAKPRNLWRSRAKLIGIPLLVSLFVVLLFFYKNYSMEKEVTKANIGAEADFFSDDLNQGLLNYGKALKSIGAFYVTSGREFNRKEFQEIALKILPLYPGLEALSWNPIIRAEDRGAFETRMRGQGFAGFEIRERHQNGQLATAALRDFYVPVAFIEPISDHLTAVGFDINSSPERKKALDASIMSHDVTATDAITFVQERKGEAGVLFVYPIWLGDSGAKDQKSDSAAGFFVAVIRMSDMISSIVGHRLKSEHLDLHIDTADGRNIFDSLKPNEKKYQEYSQVRALSGVDGVSWNLTVIPTDEYFLKFGVLNSSIVLIGGLLFSGLLGTFLLVLMGRNEMISSETLEKRRTQSALATAEARRASALQASLDAIITMDQFGRIIDFNPSAEKMFGHPKAFALGQLLADLIIPERYRRAHNDGVARYLKTGKARAIGLRMELFAIRSDGSEFPVEISPVMVHVDGEICFTGVVRDITERKSMEMSLKMAKDSAEAANAAKSAFLANMSHEIRTPLGAVLGFSELIASKRVTDLEREKYLEIIKRNGALLSNVINDILDLSKVEAGKIDIEVRSTSVLELLADIRTLLGMQAQEKGIDLIIQSDQDLPDTIQTDPLRLRQIMLNIVGNAVKFTQTGHVKIHAGLGKAGAVVPQVVFTVSDTGPGIPAEQAAKLFQPFAQADVSTKRRFGGTGLGLVLAKRLAALLGGDVELTRSDEGIGSLFTVSIASHLEIAKYEATRGSGDAEKRKPAIVQQKAISMDPQARLRDKRILVTEDAPDIRLLVGSMLTFAGAKVQTAENGKEAVEKAAMGPYDILLMDLQMPVMDGYEATRELRQQGCKLPIVALTAHASSDQMDKCKEAGFTAYLSKPIQVDKLIETLERLTARPSSPYNG